MSMQIDPKTEPTITIATFGDALTYLHDFGNKRLAARNDGLPISFVWEKSMISVSEFIKQNYFKYTWIIGGIAALSTTSAGLLIFYAKRIIPKFGNQAIIIYTISSLYVMIVAGAAILSVGLPYFAYRSYQLSKTFSFAKQIFEDFLSLSNKTSEERAKGFDMTRVANLPVGAWTKTFFKPGITLYKNIYCDNLHREIIKTKKIESSDDIQMLTNVKLYQPLINVMGRVFIELAIQRSTSKFTQAAITQLNTCDDEAFNRIYLKYCYGKDYEKTFSKLNVIDILGTITDKKQNSNIGYPELLRIVQVRNDLLELSSKELKSSF